MQNENIGGHKVAFYESIDEIPEANREKFDSYAIIGSELKPRLGTFNQKFKEARNYLAANDIYNADQAIVNIQRSFLLSANNHNLNRVAYGALIASINGDKIDDLSDEFLNELVETYIAPYKTVVEIEDKIFEVKKNFIDN